MPSTQEESGDDGLILIGLGANLPSRFGPPQRTLAAALERLETAGVTVVRRSRWWRSAPVPASDQPWFVNGVAALASELSAAGLLRLLHEIEAEFGRVRGARNAARAIDLDLLAHGRQVAGGPAPILPHPRLAERAFVLLPLAEIAPQWRHPADGRPIGMLVAALGGEQTAEPL